MFYYENVKHNLLEVDNDFATLTNIDERGNPTFEFFYSISPSDAIAYNATLVLVTISQRHVGPGALAVENHDGSVNTHKLVNNIVGASTNIKSTIKQNEDEFVIAKYKSDISSKINNEIIGQLTPKIRKSNLPQRNKSVLKLVSVGDLHVSNEQKPLLNLIAHHTLYDIHTLRSSSIDVDPTSIMLDMITRQGIDPTHVLNLTHRSVHAEDSRAGTLRPSKAQEFDNTIATQLLNYFLFPTETHYRTNTSSDQERSDVIPVLVSEPQEKITVKVIGTIDISRLKKERLYKDKGGTNFNIKFDLVDSKTFQIVSSVTKQLDISLHTQIYYTPTIRPTVTVTKSEISSRANLEITQQDPGATGVVVYKKIVSVATVDAEDYSIIGKFKVNYKQQPLLVQVELPHSCAAIYRVIPVGQLGTNGSEYTNVVIKPAHYVKIKSVALSSQPTPTGVMLYARHIPHNVVSLAFKVKNMTTYEKNYRTVGDTILVVTDVMRAADHVTIIDSDVQRNNIYEYVVELYYKSGTSEISGYTTIEVIKPEPGKVDVKITDVNVDLSGNEPNVTFTITTDLIDSNIDVVKTLLQKQDNYDLFKTEVANERQFLKSLIAHNIQRVNLTTGMRENFGTITSTSFSDKDMRKNQSIRHLVLGHHYTYEIYPLIRNPETLFPSYLKTSVDPITRKTYSWNPSKSLHPLALDRGILVSAEGLRTRYSKDDMSHGRIGVVQKVDITFDDEISSIFDQTVSRFDKYRNIISWKIKGLISSVDHFIIMKDVLGVRTIIGKLHNEFETGNCRFIHKLTFRDSGAYQYVITPVFNTYKVGISVKTNFVLVEVE